MKIKIKHIAPLQLGKMSAVLYGLLSLIFVPFIIIASLFAPNGGHFPIIFAVFLPLIYAGLGFLFGALSAFIYNLVATWLGGIEIIYEVAV